MQYDKMPDWSVTSMKFYLMLCSRGLLSKNRDCRVLTGDILFNELEVLLNW